MFCSILLFLKLKAEFAYKDSSSFLLYSFSSNQSNKKSELGLSSGDSRL